jgi:hypothetical protein
MRRTPTRLALALALLLPTVSSAHDFFLLPEAFVTADGSEATVMATVSAGFPTLEIVVDAERIAWVGAQGPGEPTLRIAAPAGNAATLVLSSAGPGLVVAGASTHPRDVEYGEDVVDLILAEYRVGPDARAATDALPRPRTLRATSRRYAKTLLCMTDCNDRSAATQPLGMAFEFVAVDGSDNQFQLRRDGTPLADYPVDLVTADSTRSHLATDAQGQIRLPANARGAMMLFAAFMQPPQGEGRFDMQLTSLTLNKR